MLERGKAEVANRMPFTIRLTYQVENPQVQEVTVGLDTGSKAIGVAATGNGKILFRGEVKLRTFTKHDGRESAVGTRAERRRSRRTRKTRYRKPRFLNRPRKKCKACGGNTPKLNRKDGGRAELCRSCAAEGHHKHAKIDKKPGWIAPTLVSKKHWHVRAVEEIAKLLPISKITVEIADWDIQKLRNPEIAGEEYQQGELRDYENRRSYVFARDNWMCRYCGGESGDRRLTVDHIHPQGRGGSDRLDNLATACKTCNDDKGNRTADEYGYPDVQKQVKQSFKHAAHVGVIKTHLVHDLSGLFETAMTYGYLTRIKRRDHLGLPKSHANDAVAISLPWDEIVDAWSPIYDGRVRARGSRQKFNSQPVKESHPQGPVFREGQGWFVPQERNTEITAKDGTVFRKGDWIEAHVGKDKIRGYITALFSSGSLKVKNGDGYRTVSPNKSRKLQSAKPLMWNFQ